MVEHIRIGLYNLRSINICDCDLVINFGGVLLNFGGVTEVTYFEVKPCH